MKGCIFCQIVAGEIPAAKLYEDDRFIVFRDINPLYRVHLLIVPKRHISSVNEVDDAGNEVLHGIFGVARRMAEKEGVSESGYRLVVNAGKDAGQVVMHVHLHLLAGEPLRPL